MALKSLRREQEQRCLKALKGADSIPEPAKQTVFNMEMQAFFGSFVLLCFVKIFREICLEKYKEFNGVNFSSTRARRKVLASFESQQFMLRALARKHCVIEIR